MLCATTLFSIFECTNPKFWNSVEKELNIDELDMDEAIKVTLPFISKDTNDHKFMFILS